MDIFEKDLSGAMVSPDEPGYDKLISTIFDTMSTAAEMNAKGWLTPEEVHEYLHRITGREIDKSTTLLPPFYVDYGKNIRIGKGCWIQQGCTFFDRGGITIGDGVFSLPQKLTSLPSTTTRIPITVARHTVVPLSSRTRCGLALVLRFCPACVLATVLLSVPTAW